MLHPHNDAGRPRIRRARQVRAHADRARTARRRDDRYDGKLRTAQPQLRIRARPRPRRDGRDHTGWRDDGCRAREEERDLRLLLGLLRLPGLDVRGAQCRDGALPLRRRARQALSRRGGLRLRHSRKRHLPRAWLRARGGDKVREALRQVHADVGAFLHARRPEAAREGGLDEAHSDTGPHTRQAHRILRRLRRARHPARQAGRQALRRGLPRGARAHRLPAAPLPVQVHQLLAVQERVRPHNAALHTRQGGRRRRRQEVRGPGRRSLQGDGRVHPLEAEPHVA